MTRIEMLKWCWENISIAGNILTLKDVENAIGEPYLQELDQMGFIIRYYDWETDTRRVHLTWLGKAYCEEMFS